MRLFVAAKFEGDVVLKIRPVIDAVKKMDLDARSTENGESHLTLKFLGKTSKDKLEGIIKALESIASGAQPFRVTLRGILLFPKPEFVRIIAVGVDSGRVVKLMERLGNDISGKKEEKPIPHITIARVSSSRNKAELLDFVEKNKDQIIARDKIIGLSLYKSQLRSEGPVHTLVKEFLLRD